MEIITAIQYILVVRSVDSSLMDVLFLRQNKATSILRYDFMCQCKSNLQLFYFLFEAQNRQLFLLVFFLKVVLHCIRI